MGQSENWYNFLLPLLVKFQWTKPWKPSGLLCTYLCGLVVRTLCPLTEHLSRSSRLDYVR